MLTNGIQSAIIKSSSVEIYFIKGILAYNKTLCKLVNNQICFFVAFLDTAFASVVIALSVRNLVLERILYF